MSDEPRFIGDPEPEPAPVADPKAVRKATGPKFKQDTAAAGNQRVVAILAALFLLAAVLGVVVALPLFASPPPKARLLTVHIERYDSPAWGVAAWAQADADALVTAFNDPAFDRTAAADRNLHQADKLRSRLAAVTADLAAPEANKRPLVLSVSGLAVVRDGVPYLLPSNADPFDPDRDGAKWLPVDDILKALETEKPVGRLLLLDLARPTADPFLGRPEETVSTAVCDLLGRRQAEGKLPYPVLVSAGPGEVSHPAPRARQSAFGLAVSDGLSGQAAGIGGTGKGDEVTVGGLARFVAHRVERYARTVHDRPQHPQLFGPTDGGEFLLTTRVTPTAPTVSTDPTKPEEYSYPAQLRAAWKRWDGLLAGDADREEPEGFARLTAALLGAERLWLGTDHTEDAGRICDQAFNRWEEDRRASRPAGRPADDGADPRAAAARWRVAARDDVPVPPEVRSAFNRYLAARLVPEAKPESWKAEEQAWLDKAAADPKVATRLVWRTLTEQARPSREQVKVLADELARQTAADPPPVERLLVRYLADRLFQTEQGISYPAEAVAAWMRAEDRLGRVLAAGPSGFGKRKELLDDADRDRQEAARLLFTARSDNQARAAAGRFAAAADGFDRAAASGGAAPKAAAAVPPLLRAVLLTEPLASAAGGEVFDRWQGAARLLGNLMGGGRTDPAEMMKQAADAATAVKRLTDLLAPARVEELEKRPRPWNKEELRGAIALTAGPVLPADPRAKAWELVRREWWARHDDARKLDAADVDGKFVPTAIAPPAVADGDPAVRRRAEAAALLLRVCGATDWRADAAKRATAAVRAADWPAANRLLRVVPPAVALVPRGMPGVAPLDTPDRDDRAAYRAWLTAQLRGGYRTPVGQAELWDRIDKDQEFRNRLAAAE